MKTIQVYEMSEGAFLSTPHEELKNNVCLIQFKTTTRKDGSINERVNVLPVCDINDNDNTPKVVRTMLHTFVAYYKETNNMQDLYEVVYDKETMYNDKGQRKTKNVLSISSYLATTTIYVCNSVGNIVPVLESEIKLSKTALKITQNMNAVKCSKNDIKNIINAQSTLVLKQSKFISNVNNAVALFFGTGTNVTTNDINAFSILKNVRALG